MGGAEGKVAYIGTLLLVASVRSRQTDANCSLQTPRVPSDLKGNMFPGGDAMMLTNVGLLKSPKDSGVSNILDYTKSQY